MSKEQMSEKEWQKFFELIEKICNLPGHTWEEKADLVEDKAAEYGSTEFEEFIHWFE